MSEIKERQHVAADVITGYCCDNCGVTLAGGESKTPEGGMTIQLEGGYGGYFDHSADPLHVCEYCSSALIKAFPFLRKATVEFYGRINHSDEAERKD